jgi:ribonuclease BN (tRNA processing enzyme)
MELRVLGCSGGIGGAGRRTTSFLLGDEVLIDAGSGVADLELNELAKIRHIFLTHSHMDHIHTIPLMIDSIFDCLPQPVVIHALPQTIKALQEHIFNDIIWPDFSALPSEEFPVMVYEAMKPGERKAVGDMHFSMIPVNHLVPTVAYVVEYPGGTFCFSGDTTSNDTLWQGLNELDRLDHLVVESAFSNAEQAMCEKSRHYCPQLLADDLKKLKHNPHVYLTHAKPGEEEMIFQECCQLITDRPLSHLSGSQILKL